MDSSTLAVADLYDRDGTAYVSKFKAVETEIGDVKQAQFFPQVKLKRWDNEANFSLRFVPPDDRPALVSTKNAAIEWDREDLTARFYDKGFVDDGGGYEFEVVLKAPPASNVLTFSMQTKGLSFHYQGEPERFAFDFTVDRPANVIGSYAVYADGKQHNKYKTGKVGHIYRPHAVDAKGVEAWCDVFVMGDTLAVTIPQAFLDAATYPVVVDPTLGYTTIGGTGGSVSGFILGAGEDAATEDGTIDNVNWYAPSTYSDSNTTYAYYDDSSGVPNNRIASSTTAGATQGAGASEWKQQTMGGSITNGTSYWIGYTSAGTQFIQYDALASKGRFKSGYTYSAGVMPDPFTAGSSDWGLRLSAYINYTASGGATPTYPQLERFGHRGAFRGMLH